MYKLKSNHLQPDVLASNMQTNNNIKASICWLQVYRFILFCCCPLIHRRLHIASMTSILICPRWTNLFYLDVRYFLLVIMLDESNGFPHDFFHAFLGSHPSLSGSDSQQYAIWSQISWHIHDWRPPAIDTRWLAPPAEALVGLNIHSIIRPDLCAALCIPSRAWEVKLFIIWS